MEPKVLEAFLAAAGLPSLDDLEEWATLAQWWRETGRDLATRIVGLEDQVARSKAELAVSEDLSLARREEANACRAQATEYRDKIHQAECEIQLLREFNRSVTSVIDKLSLAVPAVLVSQVLRGIIASCEQRLPRDVGRIDGRNGSDATTWHPVLRAILNDARRALTAIEKEGS